MRPSERRWLDYSCWRFWRVHKSRQVSTRACTCRHRLPLAAAETGKIVAVGGRIAASRLAAAAADAVVITVYLRRHAVCRRWCI
jgi:hypothetical protein